MPLIRFRVNKNMRPICNNCQQRPVAINKYIGKKIYYRKLCDTCCRSTKKLKPVPAWYKAGYRKKQICERCGFKAKFLDKQISVYHIDGNLRNTSTLNLKSVCLNCRIELAQSKLSWREHPIIPDF